MAIGRISGPLLKSNLIRNGIDLAFETDLLYLDVTNNRIGINTATPQYDLDVNGTIRTTNLVLDKLTAGNITIENNDITSDTGTIDLGTADQVVYQNKLVVDSFEINDNTIRTTDSNSNLEISPSGTGTIELLANTNVTGNLHFLRTDELADDVHQLCIECHCTSGLPNDPDGGNELHDTTHWRRRLDLRGFSRAGFVDGYHV